jgi:tRNA-splicing endonuclease subunit Sen34
MSVRSIRSTGAANRVWTRTNFLCTNYANITLHSTQTVRPRLVPLISAIKAIREKYNIVGTPVGTLLQLPTQNTFLGAPFEYSPEEIALLYSKNAILILDAAIAARKSRQTSRPLKASPFGMQLEFPKDWHREGIFLPEPDLHDLPSQTISPEELSKCIPSRDGTRYKVYEYLHNAGYWMTPGLRFGCDFTAYPGDPLRFHSHFMVHVEQTDQLPILSLVSGGRVATQTRKAWLLAGMVSSSVRVFSIEWAGFG